MATTQTTMKCSHCGIPLSPDQPAESLGAKTVCTSCYKAYQVSVAASKRTAAVPKASTKLNISYQDASEVTPQEIPKYKSISAVSAFFRLAALGNALLAIVKSVIEFRAGFSSDTADEWRADILANSVGWLIGGVVAFLVCYAIAQLLECIRDIAINSFHTRYAAEQK